MSESKPLSARTMPARVRSAQGAADPLSGRIAALEKKVNEQASDLASLHHDLAGMFLEMDQPRAAIAHAHKAVNGDRASRVFRRQLADAMALAGRYRDAADMYRALLVRRPADRVLNELLAACYYEVGDRGEAQAILQRFFNDHPCQAVVHPKDGRPVVLKMRGVERTGCRVTRGPRGHAMPSYRGGHFHTTQLINPAKFAIRDWVIAGDNIDAVKSLPSHDVMVNSIAEPDFERGSLKSLSTYLERSPDTAIVNHPDRILETTRDNNFRRIGALDGVTFPETARIERNGRSAKAMAAATNALGYGYPVILRETGSHTARSVTLARSRADAVRYFSRNDHDDFYVIKYYELRSEEGYYNKKRFICVDGALYPVVSHFDTIWNVHGKNRLTVMKGLPWTQEQERAFLGDPEAIIGVKNYKTLNGFYDLVGLDFFGIDFVVRADGSLFVFEVNASMRHSNDHSRNFPYMQPYIDRITRAFVDMLRRRAGK